MHRDQADRVASRVRQRVHIVSRSSSNSRIESRVVAAAMTLVYLGKYMYTSAFSIVYFYSNTKFSSGSSHRHANQVHQISTIKSHRVRQPGSFAYVHQVHQIRDLTYAARSIAYATTSIKHRPLGLITYAKQVHQTPTTKLSTKQSNHQATIIMSDSYLAYIADQIFDYVLGHPDKVSSGTDNINNEAPRSIHYKTCQACLESHGKETLVALLCGHYWCLDCLSRACSNIRNDIDKKIRCDDECFVKLELVVEVLPEDESRRLKSKLEEFKVPPKERCYCANTACGEWIPPVVKKIYNLAQCKKCGKSTCKLCHAVEHEGECAAPTKEDEQAAALIEKEGYQKCSQCCRVVERTDGCSHMTCYCGYEFCYHCGKQIGVCNGCGHLEPDTTPDFMDGQGDELLFTNILEDTIDEFWMTMVEEALLGLRVMPRPTSAAELTSRFNTMLRIHGYHGPRVFLRDDTTREYILDNEGRPDAEELRISDEVLFSMYGTARLQIHADGTSTLLIAGEDDEQENEEEEEEEEDEEADWDM